RSADQRVLDGEQSWTRDRDWSAYPVNRLRTHAAQAARSAGEFDMDRRSVYVAKFNAGARCDFARTFPPSRRAKFATELHEFNTSHVAGRRDRQLLFHCEIGCRRPSLRSRGNGQQCGANPDSNWRQLDTTPGSENDDYVG